MVPQPVLARSAKDPALVRVLERVRKLSPATHTMGGRTPKGAAREHPVVSAVGSGLAFRGDDHAVAFCVCEGATHGARSEFVDASAEGATLVVRWRRHVARGSVQVVTGEMGFCAAALTCVPPGIVDVRVQMVV